MLEVEDVGVRSGDLALLDPVSASVRPGETLIVRGRNGAGKSTLLRVLAGVTVPSSGRVSVAGTTPSIRDRAFRRRVASMIGLPPMAPDLTVRDHVLLVATTWYRRPAEATDKADSVLASLEIDHLVARFPHELSSGQTQLFGLSLVLARPADVLIVDEPEQRLDDEHVRVVVRALRGIKANGVTLAIATHSPRVARKLGDRTLVLESQP